MNWVDSRFSGAIMEWKKSTFVFQVGPPVTSSTLSHSCAALLLQKLLPHALPCLFANILRAQEFLETLTGEYSGPLNLQLALIK